MNIRLKTRNLVSTVALILFISLAGFGQNFTENELRAKLDTLSIKNTGLNNSVQTSISGLPLYEFIYSVAFDNNLNITIEPSLNQSVTYNFHDAKVKDVLVFLYNNFELEYEFTGSIISVKKRTVKKQDKSNSNFLDITYNPTNEFLSMNLHSDTLWKVLEKVTILSDKNFVVDHELRYRQVDAFFQNRPFDQVLEMFVKTNGLTLSKSNDGFYLIGIGQNQISQNAYVNGQMTSKIPSNSTDFRLVKNSIGNLDVYANNIDLNEIIKAAALELNTHYVLHSLVEGKANLELKNVTFDQLLMNLFRTTKYNFTEKEKLYIIGDRNMEGIRKSELIRMENRTIENVKASIPKELLLDLEISEFLELNGLIVSGSDQGIAELKSFLLSIDVVVPMIQIDIMLITSSKSNKLVTGPQAGLGSTPVQTTGIFNKDEGLNVKLGSATINALLNAITGFGVLNLGQVTENFFASLTALESDGTIEIESTPKISTLNGQKASISIGKTTYFQETQVNVSTSVTQQGVLQSKVWKPIEANFSVNIQPFVSSDEQITLTIKVSQDDFGVKVDPSSPPNMTNQTFESMVRVKNGEVILLGGLEEKKNNKLSSGLPLLSRIPVIKWFFSGLDNDKSKYKLHVLIKPTVTY